MKQLKVKEMIEKIEEEVKKNKEEVRETDPAAATTSTSSSTSNQGRNTKKKVAEKDNLETWSVKEQEGRNFELRTSLCKNKSVTKNKIELGRKGARKKIGIKELIGKFGGGDGKGPSDRQEDDESESEGKRRDNWFGLGSKKEEVSHSKASI